MEGFTKVLLILTVSLAVLSMDAEGGRVLKGDDEVVQPQTFGSFASPGFGGSFPSPGFSGSFPSPSFGGSFPSPGLTGSLPGSPSLGFGPSTFCSFPGAQCAPAQPNSPSGAEGGAGVGGSP